MNNTFPNGGQLWNYRMVGWAVLGGGQKVYTFFTYAVGLAVNVCVDPGIEASDRTDPALIAIG